jgi:hypothetical protein
MAEAVKRRREVPSGNRDRHFAEMRAVRHVRERGPGSLLAPRLPRHSQVKVLGVTRVEFAGGRRSLLSAADQGVLLGSVSATNL